MKDARTNAGFLSLWFAVSVMMAILGVSEALAQPVREAWVQRYDFEASGAEDSGTKVLVDVNGNIIVGVYTDGGRLPNFLLIKYSGNGVPLWTNRCDAFLSIANFAVDKSGNLIVTVSAIQNYEYPNNTESLTVKYSSASEPVWTNRFDGSGDIGGYLTSVTVGLQEDVFVTGYSSYGAGAYRIIKYSADGTAQWTNSYDPGFWESIYSGPVAAVDSSGNLFLGGSFSGGFGLASPAYATLKYLSTGELIWMNRYHGPDNHGAVLRAMAVDRSGNVFLTGYSDRTSTNPYDTDYATIAYSAGGQVLWTNRYSGPERFTDVPNAIAVDASGNVFVTGSSARTNGFSGNTDYVTIKYSNAGLPLWTNQYSGSGNFVDVPNALLVDGSGNVLVTGYSGTTNDIWFDRRDYATIKYSGAGVALWTNLYNGPSDGNDEANALAMDDTGNVFVTGSSARTNGYFGDTDCTTIKYSAGGVPVWTNRYDGPANLDDIANAVVVDGQGNAIVTGSSLGDYATIKYSPSGVPLWIKRYSGRGDSIDVANAVAVDASGTVFVTGYSTGTNESVNGYPEKDYATIAYAANGVPLWTNCYSGPAHGHDEPVAIAVNSNGRVFVTGFSWGTNGYDYLTIAYSSAGVPLWTNRFDGPWNGEDIPSTLAVDSFGNVFVAGSAAKIGPYGYPTDKDYMTIKYSGTGMVLWTNLYHGDWDGDDVIAATVVDSEGNVFVTGASAGMYWDLRSAVTIGYTGSGMPLWTNYDGEGSYGSPGGKALAIGTDGSVIMTAGEFGSSATIKYSKEGFPIWTNRHDGVLDVPIAVATDSSGNAFVTGYSIRQGSNDFVTVAYSGEGALLWAKAYNAPANDDDHPRNKNCLTVGSDGAVYVTGASRGDYFGYGGYDFATVKYVMPRLNLSRESTHAMKVSWPFAYGDYTLETKASVSGSGWLPDGAVPRTNDASNFIRVDPTIGTRFYRLRGD